MRPHVFVCLILSAASAACASDPPAGAGPEPRQIATPVRLHDHTLTVHLSAGLAPHTAGPLLVYATGDGGWWGKDKDLFTRLVASGYPVAGFSARDYVHHLGPVSDVERAGQLASDYVAIVAASEEALALPGGTRVVLVGKSRGAGLAVAAASTPRLRGILVGVLAIALTKEEEYVEPRRGAAAGREGTPPSLQTYDALPRIGAVPVAVIQSTRDQYLPAGRARLLFGPDTPTRQFAAVPADNHNFDGAEAVMYDEMRQCLTWILDRQP